MKLQRFTCFLFLVFSYLVSDGQTQFWSDTFEDTGAPSSGTRAPSVEYNSGAVSGFFKRTDGSDVNLVAPFTNIQGAKFWVGEDLDRTSAGQNQQSTRQTITWANINISGKTGLSFKGLFACWNTNAPSNSSATVWESYLDSPETFDFMEVQYSIDGGAFQKLVSFHASNNSNGTGVLRLDTNNDRIGDGTILDNTFQEFSATISQTGSLLTLRFEAGSNSTPEEFAIDDFRLFESAVCTPPSLTSQPVNRSVCAGNNTTFGITASGATAYQWQVNSGSGFTDISNEGIYSGATTNTLTITGVTSGINGYQYRCVAMNASPSCFTNSNAGTLTVSAISMASGTQSNVSCFGGSNGAAAITPDGGIDPYSYSWSPSGGTGSIATGLAAGTYIVTVTDDIGCIETRTYIITEPAALAATASTKTNVSCFGGSNGSATVAASGGTGIGTYTYSWSPSGGTAATASGLSAGTYTVTVTDGNGCEATQSFTITEPSAVLTASFEAQTNVSCFGGSNGSATVAASGGTGSGTYTYSWSPSGGTAATATGLSAGTYTVTVTDGNGCEATQSFTITQPAALTANAVAQTNVACFGGSTGSATVAASGGTGVGTYTYSWSPSGGTAATATGLSAGTYTVTVTDGNGCEATQSFTITEPSSALTASFEAQTNVSCYGGSNGSATVAASGGTGVGTYTYSWSPSGGTAATASGLSAGTYTVTVTDANGCEATQSFTITEPSGALTASFEAQTNVSCFGGSNGSATVAASGGTGSGTYTYSWSPFGGTAATASGLSAGTYTVTVTDGNGCEATQSFTITEPSGALTASFEAQTNVSCFGGSNGSATVAASGGTGSGTYTYSWSPSGGTAATASGLASGTYTVTVTDGNGCEATQSFTITEPSALTATAAAQTNVSCFGGSNGSATVTAGGGTGLGTYTYSWSPSGGTAATASGLSAGTYTVTVMDGNGCEATQSFTITQPAALTANAVAQTNIACFGGSNGSATVTASGGTGLGTYTYSWSPSGGTAATATGLSAGTYTVTVMDGNGCEATQSFTITQPAALMANAAAQTNIACFGGSNGSATVTASGGTGIGTYTYSWSPSGGTAATATGLSAGTYTVTVTDGNGCEATQSFTITQPAALTANAAAQTNIACFGGSNGSATVTAGGGTGIGTYTYSWSPSGGTSATASGLAAGTYTVTVTDGNGCEVTESFTITQPAALTANAVAQTNVACFGGSTGSATVAASGGTGVGTYTYSWSPSGGTAATATGLSAGTYTVTVTDGNGCEATQSFTITEPSSALTASFEAQTNVSCFGGSNGSATVAASGGTGSGTYTYSWSPSGGTAATASGLAAGTYTVTVMDGNGCEATQSFTITQPAALTANAAAQTNVACFGGSNGSATVTAGGGTGLGTYTYSWSPSGGTAATASGLTAGTYTVTVTDVNGCEATESFTITEPVALTASFGSQTNVSAFGASTGSATVNVSGGTGVGTYTYSWSPSGGTAATATVLAAGNYVVTVTDANGCSDSQSFTITQPDEALTASLTSQTPVSCFGGSNGSATITAEGGAGPYAYSWSPYGGTEATATGLAAGTYIVTVTDANNITTTVNVTITEPVALTATAAAQTNIACFGGSNGSATVAASGGTGSGTYTYSWSPSGGTAATATGLSAGTYTVTVTDANSCEATQSFTITEPAALTATAVAQTNVSCFGGSNGSATVAASGGTGSGTYTYSWSPSGGTAATASGLAAGTYTVTVMDGNGCEATQSFTITQPAVLTANAAAQTNVSCFGGSNGSATVTASGGTGVGTYTYSWSPSGGTAATATGLSAGTYTVTVTDGNGCEATQSFTITEPSSALTASFEAQTNVSCFGGSNGSATVAASGGTGSGTYTYSWSPSGGTAATASGLAAGTYTVTVMDGNGCEATQSFTITQPAVLTANAAAQTNVSCFGGSNGSATVTASGGTGIGTYTYSWSPSGGTAATASGLASGIYTVTVTDGNGCESTQSFTITQPAALTANAAAQTNVSCFGGSNGSATVTAGGGTGIGTYTYSWSPSGGTSATASGLAAGTYTVTVTDANSCEATQSFTITQPAALTANAAAQTNIACFGGSNGSAIVTASGGTGSGTYTYSWSPSGGTAATASGLTAGTYMVTVTDGNGCEATQSFTITEPEALMASFGAQTNVSAFGASTGSATVNVSGGTGVGTYTYSWSPSGGTAATATGLAAGTYTVTVTDANGCNDSQSFTITQPDEALTASLTSQTPVSCFGGSNGSATITAEGGAGPYAYSWSPYGGTEATATGLAAGTYIVTVTDANNITTTVNVSITEPVALTATAATQTNVSCFGGSNGSATVTAGGGTGLGTYTYSWSPSGGTVATASGLIAGTYTVTVTDANGCEATQSLTITEPEALTASFGAQTNVSAFGASTGSATVNVSGGTGVGTYTYSWSPSGGTAATATGLAAGTYTVTVTDANGCSDSQSFTITQPDEALTASLTSQTPVSCFGGSNGSATITAEGGAGPYAYSWSPYGGTEATATGLAAGTYIVTVTDANNITTTVNVTITEPAALTATAAAQTNVACFGGSNGSATVAADGGTGLGTYTYSWSPSGGTSATASGLAAGTYTVTVTDGNGCEATQSFTITEPEVLTASFGAQTNVSAFGASTGSATVNVSGGTGVGTYTYSWSPSGGTAATATGLAAGTYTVTVTDANGCSDSQSFTITQPDEALTASLTSQTPVSCFGGSNGSATITAEGGAGPYAYFWSPYGGTEATATGLAAGTYIVTITDANNIATTVNVTITEPDESLTTTATSQPSLACSGTASGSATVIADGGTEPYTYLWAPSGGASDTANGLTAGIYTVTVTDANGCTDTAQAVVTSLNNTPVLTRQNSTHPALCGGVNGSIAFTTANVPDGIFTLSFKKAGADTSAVVTVNSNAFSLNGLTAASYSAFILAVSGCPGSLSETVVLSDPAGLIATITPDGSTELCEDDQVTLTATLAASYLWSTGDTTRSITVDKAGLYSVTITSAQGCTSQAQITVTQKICNVPPMAVCKPHVVLVAKDNCYATLRPEDLDAGSYDNNNDWFNRSIDINPDLTVGTYNVTFTVVDIHGASTYCQSRVDVVDHTPPVALARSLTLPLDQNGNASVSAADVDAGSRDNCGPVTLTLNRTHFDCSDIGHHQVILIVTDASGNTSTALADITVVDNIPPVVKAKAVTLALDESGQATLTAADLTEVISDNCGIWDVRLSQSQFSCEHIGVNRVVLTVEDVHGGTFSDTVSVTLVDNTPPVIVAQAATLYLDETGKAHLNNTLIGLSVTDNCAVDSVQLSRTGFGCEDLGERAIRITATDLNGNISDTTVIITVTDTLAPVVRTRDVTLFLDASGQATLTAGLADDGSSDNCGILSRELSHSSFDCSDTGQHTVSFTLTDASGNQATATLLVTIRDTVPPVARTQNVILELSDAGTASLTPEEVDNFSSDNCALASMTLSQTLFSCTDLGSRLITLTVTDVNGNTATEKAEVLVRDPEGICPCSYGVLATDGIVLRSNEVSAGGIGITSSRGKVKLRNTIVNQEGTFIKAPQTRFDSESESSVYFRGSAPQPEAFRKNTHKDNGKEKIGKGESKTLPAGRYGRIKVMKDATLTFSGGEVYIRSLKVKKKAKISFADPTVLLVRDQVRLASGTEFNSSGEAARLYAGKRITVGNGTEFHGYLHTQSRLKTAGGSEQTRMEGFFTANRIKGARNTQWTGGGVLCRENEQQQQSTTKVRRNMIVEEESQQTPETEPEIRVSLSPNPASDKAQAEVFLPSGKGELTMTDIQGNVLIRKAISIAQSLHHLDIRAFRPGVYIIRVTDGEQVKTVRLVKENF